MGRTTDLLVGRKALERNLDKLGQFAEANGMRVKKRPSAESVMPQEPH